MSETQRVAPRSGCWILVLPVVTIPIVILGYVVLVWLGYSGVEAAGERVVLDIETCEEGRTVVGKRIDFMGLGDPVIEETATGLRAEVTLPDNPYADNIPPSLARVGHFEIRSGDSVVVDSDDIESATLRLDFTGEPSIAIQLDEDGITTLEDAMRADPGGTVTLWVDDEAHGERVNTPAETKGHIDLPVTGPVREVQVAYAAEYGMILAHPLPCATTVTVEPVAAAPEAP